MVHGFTDAELTARQDRDTLLLNPDITCTLEFIQHHGHELRGIGGVGTNLCKRAVRTEQSDQGKQAFGCQADTRVAAYYVTGPDGALKRLLHKVIVSARYCPSR